MDLEILGHKCQTEKDQFKTCVKNLGLDRLYFTKSAN